ncbi:MAG: M20 family peptidase [Congregibacter sp.]
MKKIALLLGLGILVLISVLFYSTTTSFEGQHVKVTARTPVAVNIDAASRRLAEAIRFPTISHDDRTRLDPVPFQQIHDHMARSFPTVHAVAPPERFNEHSLLYRIPGSCADLKPALFMGHIDVVPVDDVTLAQWTHPPFDGVIENGVIWGRGAMDDKVTVYALLEAMEMLLAEGLQPQRSIYFAFGHDEEVGGPEGAAAIAKYLKDEGLEFEFVLDEGGAITEGVVDQVDAPVAMVGIAEKGFVNLRLTVNAPGGHSSQPPDHTAAGILSQAIVNLEARQFDTDLQYVKGTLESLGQRVDFATRLAMSNLWLFGPMVEASILQKQSTAASVRTTLAATMLEGSSKSNIMPTRATAVVNSRIMPGDSVASVKAHVVSAINDPRVEVSTFMENEPSVVSPTDSIGYRLIEKHIRQLDESVLVAPYLVVGGTDSKHFYQLSDNIYRFIMIRASGVELQRIHGIDEQLPVDGYRRAIQFFYALLREAALGESEG